MRITEITVNAGRTFNDPYESYANYKPGLTLKAALLEGEDAEQVAKDLQAKAEELMDAHKADLLAKAKTVHEAEQAAYRAAYEKRHVTRLSDEDDEFEPDDSEFVADVPL